MVVRIYILGAGNPSRRKNGLESSGHRPFPQCESVLRRPEADWPDAAVSIHSIR